MSSRGRPLAASSTASWTRWATASAGSPRAAREQRGEVAVAEDLLAAGAHLGHAVGVEDDSSPGARSTVDVGQDGLDVGAEQRAEPPDRLDGARAAQHERQRVAAAGQQHPRARLAHGSKSQ